MYFACCICKSYQEKVPVHSLTLKNDIESTNRAYIASIRINDKLGMPEAALLQKLKLGKGFGDHKDSGRNVQKHRRKTA